MKWKVGKSEIHGNGIFATQNITPGTDIGVSIPMIRDTPHLRMFYRNTFGLLVNDSKIPNARTVKRGDDWHFTAIKSIKENEEILVDYQEYLEQVELESFVTGKQVSVV